MWAIAAYIAATGLKGTSSMKLRQDLGITQESVWHLAHRFRTAFEQQHDPFDGPVEIDETFIGEPNKVRHKGTGLNLGGGPVGKAQIEGVRDRPTKRIAVSADPSESISEVIDRTVKDSAVKFTDEGRHSVSLPNHESVNHRRHQWASPTGATTNGLEGFWFLFKQG